MSKQTEAVLEKQLVEQLTKLGYAIVVVPDEQSHIPYLKCQLGKHNYITFMANTWEKGLLQKMFV